MDTRTETAIAPLVKLWQQRASQFEQRIIDWAGANLSGDQTNALVQIVRESQSSIDVHSELATFAAILTQPATTN